MTVKELREALAALPDDLLVVLAKDAEGNGYSPADDLCAGEYEAVTTWYGEFRHYPEDRTGKPDNAVCIGPVN